MTTRHAWLITYDHLDHEKVEGLAGPSDAPQDLLDRLQKGEGARFKLWDDDGELYYSGRFLQDGLDTNVIETKEFPEYRRPIVTSGLEEEAFAPLWDYGTPAAGAVSITYKDKEGRWGAL